MRAAWLAVLAVLSACAPIEVVPRAAATRAVCGFEPTPPDTGALFEGVSPTPACVDRIRADFHAEGDVRTLVAGAAVLLASDLGRADGDGAWAGAAFAAELETVAEVTGGDDVSALVYDYVTARFTSARPGDCGPADAATNVLTGELLWCADVATPIDAAALLAHEARHRDGFDHVRCADRRDVCDAGRDGPVGFQAALYERAADVVDDLDAQGALERRIAVLATRVVP